MKNVNQPNKNCQYAKKKQIKAIGIDIASISKIARLIKHHNRDLNLVFSDREQNYCQSKKNPVVYYALCFGIKEAVGKALGTGLVGIDWYEIEADLTQETISVGLSGKAKTQAQKLSIQSWGVDWWKWQDSVLVNVLGFSEEQMNETI